MVSKPNQSPYTPASSSLLKQSTVDLQSFYKEVAASSEPSLDFQKGEIIGHRFAIIKLLNQGSFSKVFKAQNLKTNDIVALKITENSPKTQRHALQEIDMLTDIQQYESNNGYIVKMTENFYWKEFICTVFELLYKNLYQIIKETNFGGMALSNVKVFAWQILMALKLLKVPELSIIHCDLKPENIMLVSSQKAGLKLVDFGSACKKKLNSYRYVQSRYYRAPEVILEQKYDFAVDIWSAGCIFAELLTGKPIFLGIDDEDQMVISKQDKIEEVLSSQMKSYFTGFSEDPNFENFFDLLWKMLRVDPGARISPEEALSHPFFTEVKISVKDSRLTSPVYQSTASSIENSPSSKSSALESLIFSPSRLGSCPSQEEQLIKFIGEFPRRTSLQEPRRPVLFSKRA